LLDRIRVTGPGDLEAEGRAVSAEWITARLSEVEANLASATRFQFRLLGSLGSERASFRFRLNRD
jgi:hypothetical protein